MCRRLAKTWAASLPASTKLSRRRRFPKNVRINLRGMVQGMRISFKSFGMGLLLAVLLVYLVLVAQFQSFVDPLIILLAVPTGLTGVLVILFPDRHDAERHVAHGRGDDGGDCHLEQHSDC